MNALGGGEAIRSADHTTLTTGRKGFGESCSNRCLIQASTVRLPLGVEIRDRLAPSGPDRGFALQWVMGAMSVEVISELQQFVLNKVQSKYDS